MTAKLEYSFPGYKSFRVMGEKDCTKLQQRVLHRIIDAEIQASHDDIRDRTRIVPGNYDFELLGAEDLSGRPAHVIRIRPRHKERFAVDGRIWVDREDAAVARIDGDVCTGSFWVRSSHVLQCYKRFGPYWLMVSNHSDAHVRVLGEAHLNIETFDYDVRTS